MTEVNTSDPDAVHDSAALWYERAGRCVKLSLDATDEAHRWQTKGRKLRKEGNSDRTDHVRAMNHAREQRSLSSEYILQAKKFAQEGRRAERLGRL